MGTEEERLVALGRSDVDAAWDVLVFNLAHNMYLDPFIFGTSWGNPSAWRSSCLAHELRLSLSSQTALEDRLIPQAQRVIGGLYSVRGYDSGEIVGDDAVVARVEYGLHLPRMLKPGPPVALGGHRLRLRPMGPFGATDVDVVLRLFTDYARAWISDIDSVSESDQELWSAGVGLDLNLVDRLTLSLDWGQALMDVVSKADADVTKSGDSQLHFSLTLAF